MTRNTDIKRYAADETVALHVRDIASDPDWRDIPRDWFERAETVTPEPKKLLSLRLDADVIAWFRAQGPGATRPG